VIDRRLTCIIHGLRGTLCGAALVGQTGQEINLIADLAKQSGDLERKLMVGQVSAGPEPFLEELIRAWYELLAIRTIAGWRPATPDVTAPEGERPLADSCAEQVPDDVGDRQAGRAADQHPDQRPLRGTAPDPGAERAGHTQRDQDGDDGDRDPPGRWR
jgi:hypothetical protein